MTVGPTISLSTYSLTISQIIPAASAHADKLFRRSTNMLPSDDSLSRYSLNTWWFFRGAVRAEKATTVDESVAKMIRHIFVDHSGFFCADGAGKTPLDVGRICGRWTDEFIVQMSVDHLSNIPATSVRTNSLTLDESVAKTVRHIFVDRSGFRCADGAGEAPLDVGQRFGHPTNLLCPGRFVWSGFLRTSDLLAPL